MAKSGRLLQPPLPIDYSSLLTGGPTTLCTLLDDDLGAVLGRVGLAN